VLPGAVVTPNGGVTVRAPQGSLVHRGEAQLGDLGDNEAGGHILRPRFVTVASGREVSGGYGKVAEHGEIVSREGTHEGICARFQGKFQNC